MQALVSGRTDLHPEQLKPETYVGARIVVQGKRIATARERVLSNEALRQQPVLVSFVPKYPPICLVVEGAASSGEVDLPKAELTFALPQSRYPAVLVGGMNRRPLIAQLVGIKILCFRLPGGASCDR